MKNILALLLVVIIYPIAAAANAFLTNLLWGWIVVPTFHVQPLTMWQCFGLSLVIGWFKSGATTNDNDKPDLLAFVVLYFITMLLGYITHIMIV